MVTEAVMNLLQGVIDWFLSLFPQGDPPAWIMTVGDVMADVIERASGLGAWFPFVLLGTLAVFLLGLWAVLWTIKGGRWVWGLTPFSGGS